MGISREQALDCFRSDDLIGIGMEADAVRRKLHPEGVVSYAVSAVVSSVEQTSEAEELGATGVVLRGFEDLESLLQMVAAVKRQSPEMWVQALTATELLALGLPVVEAIARLRNAGLDSLGTASPELVDDAWVGAHRAAHRAGMGTIARVVFGGETIEARLDALEAVRDLQAETGGFVALAPVSFHAVGGRELDETTAVEYLKTLAVARMFVDNIENLESDWTTQGRKVLQMGLRFGGNDVGWVGAGATEEELRRVIRDAGFKPAQRDLGYRVMMLG